MKHFFIQAFNLMRQNRFHTIISIIGTAVTIAFIMVVVMIYHFRTVDIAPETARSRMMYLDKAMTSRKLDQTNGNRSGIGRMAYETLFTDLPGVKDATWYRGVSKTSCSLAASAETYNFYVRPVASNWFSFFDYEFVAGRPFSQEEYDAQRWAIVVTEHTARQLFGTTDVVGKEFLINFFEAKIVGVVRDVSAIFQTAYADAFSPFSLENEDGYSSWTAGLGGARSVVLKPSSSGDAETIRAEIQRREAHLNDLPNEYKLKLGQLYTHTEYTFFRDEDVNASLVYGLLVIILLIVPAINISGMTHAQMQERLTEIAVRKAYGASNASVIGRFFSESLLSTLLGGILGYLLSCLLVWGGRTWMLGNGGVELSGITVDGGLLLHPSLFLFVFCICIVFNLLSVLLPVWIATRRDIASTIKGE